MFEKKERCLRKSKVIGKDEFNKVNVREELWNKNFFYYF